MGCEILFCKPKRIKDLVSLGVKKKPCLLIIPLYKKQYIEGKNKKRRRENRSYRRKI
ncbi:hypothetical protein THERU_08405 [Thermocrinis ruber]|uniref:Uncharacterized protein n=1 Tax=Thermocrinis ruber TaxID=75906 RepID=W0DJ61_9AQUI|nr:hypothetical protein THERU_08405 [Thermocrinis ruber]